MRNYTSNGIFKFPILFNKRDFQINNEPDYGIKNYECLVACLVTHVYSCTNRHIMAIKRGEFSSIFPILCKYAHIVHTLDAAARHLSPLFAYKCKSFPYQYVQRHILSTLLGMQRKVYVLCCKGLYQKICIVETLCFYYDSVCVCIFGGTDFYLCHTNYVGEIFARSAQ